MLNMMERILRVETLLHCQKGRAENVTSWFGFFVFGSCVNLIC